VTDFAAHGVDSHIPRVIEGTAAARASPAGARARSSSPYSGSAFVHRLWSERANFPPASLPVWLELHAPVCVTFTPPIVVLTCRSAPLGDRQRRMPGLRWS